MNVYISSTYSDLKFYREALFRALQKLEGVAVIGMEYFSANDIPPSTVAFEKFTDQMQWFLSLVTDTASSPKVMMRQ